MHCKKLVLCRLETSVKERDIYRQNPVQMYAKRGLIVVPRRYVDNLNRCALFPDYVVLLHKWGIVAHVYKHVRRRKEGDEREKKLAEKEGYKRKM